MGGPPYLIAKLRNRAFWSISQQLQSNARCSGYFCTAWHQASGCKKQSIPEAYLFILISNVLVTQEADGEAGITFAALSFAVGPLIGRYCGTKMPSDIRSTTGVLSLTFHTDLAVAKDGFSAQYYLIHQEVPESKLEMCVHDSLVSPVFPVFYLAYARVKQAEVCPGAGSPPAVQFHLGLFSISDRSKISIRILLSDLLLAFH